VRSEEQSADADRRRASLLLDAVRPGATVACYLSTGGEPHTLDLVDRLAVAGHVVLVPLLAGRHDPAWARYPGRDGLRPGLWGIPEPVGADGAPAEEVPLSQADLILCSGLAATRDGRRLGVGGGWYDRALGAARGGVPVWMLLDDADVVDHVPTEAHDRRVDALVTQSGILPTHG